MEKVILCWSSGKDSAFTLHQLRKDTGVHVVGLLTTLTEQYGRVSMHGVRHELLEAQAAAAGLPLHTVWIPPGATNELYEARMGKKLQELKAVGVLSVAFGDIFLEDLRKYRQDKLFEIGMRAIFPIWKRNTSDLAAAFIQEGFRAVLTCVDTHKLDGRFAGSEYDSTLLNSLPGNIDPCGENGEFHSFCYGGPIFTRPLGIRRGQVVLRDNRYSFCDILPQ